MQKEVHFDLDDITDDQIPEVNVTPQLNFQQKSEEEEEEYEEELSRPGMSTYESPFGVE